MRKCSLRSGGRRKRADSPTRTVYAFDYDRESGGLSNQRPLITFAESDGYPDGLCVDAEGCLWIAAWGGQVVFRHAPDGQRIGRVDVPTPHVTSCCFVGSSLDRLAITTAWDELPAETAVADTGAGRVWVADIGSALGTHAKVARVTADGWNQSG